MHVIEMIARTPCEGMVPKTVCGVCMEEVDLGCLTVVAPYKGQDRQLSDVLMQAHAVAFPVPNRISVASDARMIWFGKGQGLLVGPYPDSHLIQYAALVDQSDAWAVVQLEGAYAVDILTRLVPIDLRGSAFAINHTARTRCGHMMASVSRTGERTFQVMVFRSMARTLIRHIELCMEAVEARGAMA